MGIQKRNGRDKRLPVRLRREAWPAWVPGRLTVHDPAAIIRTDVTVSDFQRAMFNLHVGGTVKITWSDRQHAADQLLADNLPDRARIVEIGASDGSTAVDLIRQLGDRFASYVITDRFVRLTWSQYRGRTYLFREFESVLVAGRLAVAWPSLSPAITALLGGTILRAGQQEQHEVLLLNPDTRSLINNDPRVTWAEHDIFVPLPSPVDVIKVGNLLRRVYFSDVQIASALHALRGGLVNGGLLLVADHATSAEAAGLYRATADGFELLSGLTTLPEIHDLILATERLHAGSA